MGCGWGNWERVKIEDYRTERAYHIKAAISYPAAANSLKNSAL